MAGTAPPPIKVEEVYYYHDGKQCALKLAPATEGWGRTWTDYSETNCQYKAGDVLK